MSMDEKYYREALSNIRDYASNRRECSLYLEIVEKMASDALREESLTPQSSKQYDVGENCYFRGGRGCGNIRLDVPWKALGER